jgi:hypothetical protein
VVLSFLGKRKGINRFEIFWPLDLFKLAPTEISLNKAA